MVIFHSGVNHEELCKLAEQHFGKMSAGHNGDIPALPAARFTGSEVVHFSCACEVYLPLFYLFSSVHHSQRHYFCASFMEFILKNSLTLSCHSIYRNIFIHTIAGCFVHLMVAAK